MMKVSSKGASRKVDFDYFLRSSDLERTVELGCNTMRTNFVVESNRPGENVPGLIRNPKKRMHCRECGASSTLISIIELSGKSLLLERIMSG